MFRLVAAMALGIVSVALPAVAQDLIAHVPLSAMNLPTPYYSSIGDVDGDTVPELIVVSQYSRIVTIIGIRGATGTGNRQPVYNAGGWCAEQIPIPADPVQPHIYPLATPHKLGSRDVILVQYWQQDVELRTLTKIACR